MQFDDTGAQDGGPAMLAGRRDRCIRSVARLLCIALMLAPTLLAWAGAGAAPEGTTHLFDIPAQPLPQALQLYGETTGVAVLIDARMLGGLRSTAVSGRHAPLAALQMLLRGTGLAPRFVDGGGFTLVAGEIPPPGDTAPANAGTRSATASAAPQHRAAWVIQQSLEAALCGARATRPGSYRVALQLWVDPASHRVGRADVLESSGDPRRDAAILRRLDDLAMPGLPVDLPQPVTLLLLPHAAGRTPPCRSAR
ncbi:STN domain-containing protein [Stenotrophomonas indicatrix]